jgi:hypothetical protein
MKTKKFLAAFIVACFTSSDEGKTYYYSVGDDSFQISSELYKMCKSGDVASVEFDLAAEKGSPYEWEGKQKTRNKNSFKPNGTMESILDLKYQNKRKTLEKELAAL